VVFSTISNFVINKRLKDGDFDNLIVDEASMLALPQLIALARKITKRIILVGDFQQLSPITVAGVPLLKDNVFKLCGIDIDHTDHPALRPLLNQRRSNPKLVDIINDSFYAGNLHAENKRYTSIVARPPYSECVVGMYSVSDGEVRFTKGGTRQNVANSEAVMNLLDLYSEDEEAEFDIGVITPYTGQVSLLKALFAKKNYDTDFQDRVKIGTVHTFQGSECDVIIFDMVDCSKFEKGKKPYFGKIYAGEQGEQLLNVAISRARHKLIVVCDPDYLTACPGNVISNKSITIFNNLLKARWTSIK
jgi:superfamily I DNA and/or RNA helicase